MAETDTGFQNTHVSSWGFLKFQEGRFWLVQGSAWLDLMGDCLGRQRGADSWMIFQDSLLQAQADVQEGKQKW